MWRICKIHDHELVINWLTSVRPGKPSRLMTIYNPKELAYVRQVFFEVRYFWSFFDAQQESVVKVSLIYLIQLIPQIWLHYYLKGLTSTNYRGSLIILYYPAWRIYEN